MMTIDIERLTKNFDNLVKGFRTLKESIDYKLNEKGDFTMKKTTTTSASTTKISPPWVQYVNELKALFAQDEEVHIEYNDEEGTEVILRVDNHIKADALSQILPVEKEFGNVTLHITVIPANKLGANKAMLYRNAFNGNGAFSQVIEIGGISSNTFTFVEFQPKVVQFYNDNLADPHGNKTTLYQDIAKDVFEDTEGVFFCTEEVPQ